MNKQLIARWTIISAMLLGLGGCHFLGETVTIGPGAVASPTTSVNTTPTTGAGAANTPQRSNTPSPAPSPSAARSSTPPASSPQQAPTSSAPTSAPTSASAPPSATAPTPASTSATYSCVTSTEPHGTCGPYDNYPQISIARMGSSSTSLPTVEQDAWSDNPAYTSTLHASSPGDWYLTANVSTHFGGVQAFPNTGWGMPWPEIKVGSYSSIASSYSESFTHNAQTMAWAAYDLWLNNWADEVMIQTDISANSFYDCAPVATATFGGDPWHLCVFGSERVWRHGPDESHLINQPSGTIDVKAILIWMEQHGYLPGGSTWTAGSFGFEICDTGGSNATFAVHGFSWHAQ